MALNLTRLLFGQDTTEGGVIPKRGFSVIFGATDFESKIARTAGARFPEVSREIGD